jgi:mannose-6-phosphate isomerase-like protein (cupin superfamily)
MNIKEVQKIQALSGHEDTQIRQIFAPDNTNNTIRYSIAHCTIKPGKTSKPHAMKTSEVYYILEGKGIMYVKKEQKQITKDEIIFVPPNSKQYLENIGETDLIALCIVDPAWRQEDEVIE